MSSIYDQLKFTSFPSPERHPLRLQMIGRLLGIQTAEMDQARVLEIGCGTGMNLIPWAVHFPKAKFVGIDPAADQLDQGKKLLAQLELKNIELLVSTVQERQAAQGKFDYIICHGLYSWSDPETQAAILRTCQESLSPNGLALVSFNSSPGWQVRSRVRELLQMTDKPEAKIEERIELARRTLQHGIDHQIDDHTPYGMQIKEELKQINRSSDALLMHEMLSPHIEAPTLLEFCKRASAAGLTYLGDAKFGRNFFAQELTGQSEAAPTDLIQREAFYDLLYPRAFRSAILGTGQKSIMLQSPESVLQDFFISAPLVALDENPVIDDETELEFCDPREQIIGFKDPVMKAALLELCDFWPETRLIDELMRRAAKKVGKKLSEATLKHYRKELFGLFTKGYVEFWAQALPITIDLGAKPKLEQITRTQAAELSWVSTWRNEYLPLKEFHKRLIKLLDGTRNQRDLECELIEQAKAQDLRIAESGVVITDAEQQSKIISEQLLSALEDLRRAGIFFGKASR